MERKDEIQKFWNEQAKGGFQAGSRDVMIKKLEMKTFAKYLRDGQKVLEIGCGNGVTALDLCRLFDLDYDAMDYADVMIEEAKKKLTEMLQKKNLKRRPRFQTGDLRNPPEFDATFDVVLTERVLINLETWEEQANSIRKIASYVKPGGVYLMCENSEDALENINALRADVGLPAIQRPWHNRYFREADLETLRIDGFRLESVDRFSSTYYFLSRVINAALAVQEGKEPQYEAPINQLSFQLPSIGSFSQVSLWIWRKT